MESKAQEEYSKNWPASPYNVERKSENSICKLKCLPAPTLTNLFARVLQYQAENTF